MYKTNIKNIDSEIRNNDEYSKYLKKINGFFLSNDIENIDTKIFDLTGNDYVVSTEYENQEDNIIECHKKYIDVHVTIEGDELIEVGNIDSLHIAEEYNEEEDSILYGGSLKDKIKMYPGDILFLFPGEAHKTKIYFKSKKVKKLIFKMEI